MLRYKPCGAVLPGTVAAGNMHQNNLQHLLNTKDLDNQLTRKTDFLERSI